MRALLLALILTVPTIGCGSKTEEKPNEAVKTGSESTAMNVREGSSAAGAGSSDAPTNAAPLPGYEGGHAAQDKATEVEQARAVANVEAATAKEAVDADAAVAHKIVHDKLQSEFDASDRTFIALKVKAADATGATKKKADAAIADITKREATVMAGIAKLRDATGAQWDKTKTQLDANIAAFNKAIAALEITLR